MYPSHQLWSFMAPSGTQAESGLFFRMTANLYKLLFGTQVPNHVAVALAEEDWAIETGEEKSTSSV
jgi:hypothetical protein